MDNIFFSIVSIRTNIHLCVVLLASGVSLQWRWMENFLSRALICYYVSYPHWRGISAHARMWYKSISPVFSNVKHCVSVLYRPPSSPVSFFDDFCNTLQHLSPHLFTSFMVVGDFNINFLKTDTPNFCKLNGILQTISLSQVVHTATHTDCNGRPSLIDLALVSRKKQLL